MFHSKKSYIRKNRNKNRKVIKNKKRDENFTNPKKTLKDFSKKSANPKLNTKSISYDDGYKSICSIYGYDLQFSRNITSEIKDLLAFKTKEIEREITKRVDCRYKNVITIDGKYAKDLDDAISLEIKGNRYYLSVYVADVEFYVKENTFLDKEARFRGNSVYLGNYVIPMLPKELSNGVCSLNSGKDCLVVAVDIEYDFDGNLCSYKIYEAIIRVGITMTYELVDSYLDITFSKDSSRDSISRNISDKFLDMIIQMKKLSEILYDKRIKNGSIDLNIADLEFEYDKNSYPINAFLKNNLISHKIIEEFMLAANQVIGSFLKERNKTGVYRVHEEPDEDFIPSLSKHSRSGSVSIRRNAYGEINKKDIQNFLADVKGRSEEFFINYILLRSMKQAYYSVEDKGHFALSFKNYLHFTSPIRRYADLLNHRSLKECLKEQGLNRKISKKSFKKRKKNIKIKNKIYKKIAAHISLTERKAIHAERKMIKFNSALLLKDKMGEIFTSIITNFSDRGIYVQLIPYGVEGIVLLHRMKKRFQYNAKGYIYESVSDRDVYKIGDKIKVQLSQINLKTLHIEFEII